MFINELKLMQRKNLGNYEHREVTVGVSLSDGEDFNEAANFAEEALTSLLTNKPMKTIKAQTKVSTNVSEEEPPVIPADEKATKAYSKMSIAELKAELDEKGINYPSKIKKVDLIALCDGTYVPAKDVPKAETKKAKTEDVEKVATLEQAREAAKQFKVATGSSEKTKALIEEVTGYEKLKDVEDASLFHKFIEEVNDRI